MHKRNATHGESYSRVYNIWAMMRQRCNNPKAANYKWYGGRGIKCCEQWARFEVFLRDMGYPPSLKHTLDRIDRDKDYTPENCRWTTDDIQANNRSNNVNVTAFGKTQTLAQWARSTGLSRDQIRHRIFVMGMTAEDALRAERMSWVQRPVLCRSLDGLSEARFDSIARAAKQMQVKRESLWAALKRSSPVEFAGYCWEYAPQEPSST